MRFALIRGGPFVLSILVVINQVVTMFNNVYPLPVPSHYQLIQ